MRRVIVITGGRAYKDEQQLNRVLTWEHTCNPFWVLLHGNATGADRLAKQWALSHGVQVVDVDISPQDGPWPGAGPRRNGRMLRLASDWQNAAPLGLGLVEREVIAFPGGRGTDDCVRQALRLGLVVRGVAV